MEHYKITQDFVFGDDVLNNEYYLKKFYLENIEKNLEHPTHDSSLFFTMECSVRAEYGHTLSLRLPGISKTGVCDSLFTDMDTDIFINVHHNYFPALLHNHTYFELIYVLDGACINYTEGQPLSMKRASALIVSIPRLGIQSIKQ